MSILKNLVDMYHEGDKIALMYSTTSGRTTMIHEDGYDIEEFRSIKNIADQKEILVDSAEHLTFDEIRKLAHVPAKVILLFDQVGGINGLTIDMLRTLKFSIVVPPMNSVHACGGDATAYLKKITSKLIINPPAAVKYEDAPKVEVLKAPKQHSVVISNTYSDEVEKAMAKNMDAIAALMLTQDGVGNKISGDIAKLSYGELPEYVGTLKEQVQNEMFRIISAIDDGNRFLLSKYTYKSIRLEDALFGKSLGISGTTARRNDKQSFYHTFEDVAVDIKRLEDESDESYAVKLYYAMTRATATVCFTSNVDKSIFDVKTTSVAYTEDDQD